MSNAADGSRKMRTEQMSVGFSHVEVTGDLDKGSLVTKT